MYNDNTNKIAETAKRIMAGESVEESVNEATELNEAKIDKVLDLLVGAIDKNASKPEFQKASQAYEDWANAFGKSRARLLERGPKAFWMDIEEALDIRLDDGLIDFSVESVNEARDTQNLTRGIGSRIVKGMNSLIKDLELLNKQYPKHKRDWNDVIGSIENARADFTALVQDIAGEDIQEEKGDKEAYQKFFNDTLKKYGVKSPAELKGDDEKKFYDEIDAGWKGDDEKNESVELEEGKIDLKKKVKNEKEFESYMDSFKGPDILAAVEKLDSGEKHQKGTVGFFLSQQMSMKEETVRLDARRREFREKIKKLAYAKARKMIQDQDEEEVDEGILSKAAGIGAVAAGVAIKKRSTRKGRNDLKQKKIDKLKSKAQEIDRSKKLKTDLAKAKDDLKKKKQQKESVMFESVVLTESQMSMIAKIKNDFKHFKKGKKYALAASSLMALKQLMLAIGNNEDLLKGLVKADIPYVSAISKHVLIAKHGYSGRDFDSNIQDIEDYEDYDDDDEETAEIVPVKPTLMQKIKNLFRRK